MIWSLPFRAVETIAIHVIAREKTASPNAPDTGSSHTTEGYQAAEKSLLQLEPCSL